MFFKKKKKDLENIEVNPLALDKPAFDEPIPDIQEGYNAGSKVMVRLVGNRPTKSYRVSGIDDVASKNNWKAWLYLAPVIVLVVIFLLYPLVNTFYIGDDFGDSRTCVLRTYIHILSNMFKIVLRALYT